MLAAAWVGPTILVALIWIIGGLALMFIHKRRAPYSEDGSTFYTKKGYKQLKLKQIKDMSKIPVTMSTVRITLPRNLIMIVPMESIIKIDGYTLMLDPNGPDYEVIRDGVREFAPCVPTVNINRGVITFE